MPTYAVFFRALNVGGHGKMKMDDLRTLCVDVGLRDVRTYIQSGNVVLTSRRGAARIERELDEALSSLLDKEKVPSAPRRAFVRTVDELASILKNQRYEGAPGKFVQVFFYDTLPEGIDEMAGGQDGEDWQPLERELCVHYPKGMGRSKLKVPGAKDATARNLNTLERVLEMCRE